MTRTFPALAFVLAFSVVAATGCTSTPPTRYHSLLATDAPGAVREAGQPPLVVDLGPVRVPAAVDQTQWVVRLPDQSLRILEGEQWVAPLRDELRAALFERLAQRFGAIDARAATSTQTLRVKVDVQRFESIAGKEVWIDSVWSVHTDTARVTPLVCRSSLREPAGGDLAALAAAHRRAVANLADQIGTQLAALSQGAAPRCP